MVVVVVVGSQETEEVEGVQERKQVLVVVAVWNHQSLTSYFHLWTAQPVVGTPHEPHNIALKRYTDNVQYVFGNIME